MNDLNLLGHRETPKSGFSTQPTWWIFDNSKIIKPGRGDQAAFNDMSQDQQSSGLKQINRRQAVDQVYGDGLNPSNID